MSPIDLHTGTVYSPKSTHQNTEKLTSYAPLRTSAHAATLILSLTMVFGAKKRGDAAWKWKMLSSTTQPSVILHLGYSEEFTNACSQILVNMSMHWRCQVQNIFSFQKAMLAQPSFRLSSEWCDAFLFKGSLLSNSQRFQATGLREVVNLPSSIWLRFESLQMTTCATFSRFTHKSGIHLQFICN